MSAIISCPLSPRFLNWDSDEPYAIWEAEDVHGNVYQVTSFLTEWQEQKAYAHVIMDTTEEAHEARQLANKAYHDPGTGIETAGISRNIWMKP